MPTLALLFLCFQALSIQIVEHNRISQVTTYLEPGKKVLVIFDIDNTIVKTCGALGSDQWFEHTLTMYKKQGLSDAEALKITVQLYSHVQNHVKLKPVERGTIAFIESLQKQNIPVIALTTRSIVKRTLEQLAPIVDFSRTAVSDGILDLTLQHPAFYKKGIIFSGDNKKGVVLSAFLDRTGYQPDKIIYVDDKEKHILSVGQAVEERHIQFVGIRYSRLDQKVKNFKNAKAQKKLVAFLKKHPLIPEATPAMPSHQAA